MILRSWRREHANEHCGAQRRGTQATGTSSSRSSILEPEAARGEDRCDEVREVDGARQRLPDRRGGGTPVGAERGADKEDLQPAVRGRLGRDPAPAPARGSGLRRRAPDLQPRWLGGGALGKWRTGGGDVSPAPGLDRRGRVHDPDQGRADHAHDPDRARRDAGAGPRQHAVSRFPLGRRRRARRARGGRAKLALPAHIDRQSPMRDRGRRGGRGTGGAGSDDDRPRDRAPRAVSEPDQRQFLLRQGRTGAGSDLRAWGGGDALLRNRGQRGGGGGRPRRCGEPADRPARRGPAAGRGRATSSRCG